MSQTPLNQNWPNKFRVAFAGLFWALRDQASFHIHLIVTAAVIILAALLPLQLWQWVALILATGMVFTAELLNTALELLVKVVHPDHNPRIGRALDVAAAAVLTASLTAVAIGILILGPEIYRWCVRREVMSTPVVPEAIDVIEVIHRDQLRDSPTTKPRPCRETILHGPVNRREIRHLVGYPSERRDLLS